MMFWAWFQWHVSAEPYSLEEDNDTFKMNATTLHFWRSTPERCWGLAITLDVMLGL